MQQVHVLTVSPGLPARMLDEILTSTERTLCDHGAQRVWIDAGQLAVAVVAEFSAPEEPAPV